MVGKTRKRNRLARVIGLQPIAQPSISAGYSATGNNRETKLNNCGGVCLGQVSAWSVSAGCLARGAGERCVLHTQASHPHSPLSSLTGLRFRCFNASTYSLAVSLHAGCGCCCSSGYHPCDQPQGQAASHHWMPSYAAPCYVSCAAYVGLAWRGSCRTPCDSLSPSINTTCVPCASSPALLASYASLPCVASLPSQPSLS